MTNLNKFLIFILLLFWIGATYTLSAHAEVHVWVSIKQQKMFVISDVQNYEWPVSTARRGYHTPSGSFRPYSLQTMHYSSKYDNSPMPYSMFFKGGYAIHGTHDVKRLGTPASHGCVRLDTTNAKILFDLMMTEGKNSVAINIVP